MLHINLAAGIAIALYAVTTVMLLRRLFASPAAKASKQGVLLLGLIAVVLHAIVLYHSVYGLGPGMDVSFYTVFSLIAWLVSLLLLLAALREPVENLGIVIFPVTAVAIVIRLFTTQQHSLTQSLSPGMDAHILSSIVAYSLLTIAALQSILLYIQDVQLHNKRPGGFVRALPSLETMEKLLFRLIGIGFLILSVSLLTGVLFIENLFAQHLVHKFVLSISAWVIFAVLLWGRWRFGWRGRIAIRWTLAGFILLLLAYFGSKFVIELILKR